MRGSKMRVRGRKRKRERERERERERTQRSLTTLGVAAGCCFEIVGVQCIWVFRAIFAACFDVARAGLHACNWRRRSFWTLAEAERTFCLISVDDV